MADRTAIRALLEAIEAGLDTEFHHAAVFPSESAYGHCTWHDSHTASTRGSLDAAVALIMAVLPGWEWQVSGYGAAYVWFRDLKRAERLGVFKAKATTPARALLIAGLKAMEAKAE